MACLTDEMFFSGIFPGYDDVVVEAVDKCLDAMYRCSYPKTTWQEYQNFYKGKTEEEARESKFYEAHYLPDEVYKEIVDIFLDRYHLKNRWRDYVETVEDYLKNGGKKDVWIEKDDESGYRGYADTPKLADVIGEENAEKVFELISDCKNFYRMSRDEESFRFTVMNYSPCSNKEIVEKYWHEHGKPDFKIDDSIWEEKDEESAEKYSEEDECLENKNE